MAVQSPKPWSEEKSGKKPLSRHCVALKSIGYALLFLLLWTAAALICRPLDKRLPPRMPEVLIAPGAVLAVAGVALTLTAVGFFIFRGRGTPAVFDPPKKFVPTGPYRLVRNPMYCGYVAMLLGLGFFLTSVSIVLFALAAFFLIHTFVTLAEEPGLRKRFGQEYEDYCRAVPRWIPSPTRRRPPA